MEVARKAVIAVGIVLASFGAGPFQQASDSDQEKELQDMYMEFLATEGYRPEIDDDGDVQFKREGSIYFIGVSETDPGFFRLVLPNIWPIESDEERTQVLVAVDYANRITKVSKVYTTQDNVWVSIELFVATPQDFKAVFNRSLRSVDAGVSRFAEKMKELRG